MFWWFGAAALAAVPTDLHLVGGAERSAVQDAFVSPLGYQGTQLTVSARAVSRTEDRVDIFWGGYTRGELSGQGGSTSTQSVAGGGGGWTVQPRLAEQGPVSVYLGGTWSNRVRYRWGRAESYAAWSTLGPAVTVRWRPTERLRLDGGLSIPLLGVAARPSYTVVTLDGLPETISLDVTSVHNLQGVAGRLLADWETPSGANVQLGWEGGWHRLTTTDTLKVASSTFTAALVWRWS